MGLFSKSGKASEGVVRVDGIIKELYGDNFHFDGEDFWMGVEGSTVVTILYVPVTDSAGAVHVNAHVIRDVVVTPALCSDLLTNPNYHFLLGRWQIEQDDSGKSIVLLGIDLIDYEGSLDATELGEAIAFIAGTADEIDDGLVAKYGGKTAVASMGG